MPPLEEMAAVLLIRSSAPSVLSALVSVMLPPLRVMPEVFFNA